MDVMNAVNALSLISLPAAMALLGGQRAGGKYTSRLETRSVRVRRDFTPDGSLQKAAWRSAKWVTFDHDWSGKHRYPQAQTRVASVWTPQQFYLAYWCKYTQLNVFDNGDPSRDTIGLWNRDVVEAFINAHPEHVDQYYEFEVAPNNLWVDLKIDLDRKPFNSAAWNSGYLHATKIDSGKRVWTCEMRIPVESIAGSDYSLASGAVWRINLYRADGPGSAAERRLLTWSPTLRPNFHTPTRFGRIRFVS
ncbi:MAG: carbohydrate-binding family 9-like protein [Terriglobia bacterium]